jgi:hypothetical protein
MALAFFFCVHGPPPTPPSSFYFLPNNKKALRAHAAHAPAVGETRGGPRLYFLGRARPPALAAGTVEAIGPVFNSMPSLQKTIGAKVRVVLRVVNGRGLENKKGHGGLLHTE